MGKEGRMQFTYKTRKEAEKAERHWASKAGNTHIVVNKRKKGNTYTLKIQF